MPVAATFDIQMQFSGSAGAWTSVGADVALNPPVSCAYGIRGTGPADRLASTGTLTFSLNNSAGNSGGKLGYYSPGNANCRAGFELGVRVRAALTYSGSTFYKFVGSLEEISPIPGSRGARLTNCTAVDWMDEAAKQNVRLISTQINQRGDQVIATVVAAMTRKPAASALNAGDDTFPFAIDNNRDVSQSPITIFKNVADSELGFVYLKGDQNTGGVLTFLDRHGRASSGSSLVSLSSSMAGMVPRRSRAAIYNDVQVTVHPRSVDAAASILYSLGTAQLVTSGSTASFLGSYTNPAGGNTILAGAYTTCNLVPTTDYVMNTASDGSGADATANAVMSSCFGGNSFQITACNSLFVDAWLTKLQVRGRGLYDYQPVTMISDDANSAACYGVNTLALDMPYQTGAISTGKNAADYMLQVWSQPLTRIESVNFVGNDSDTLMTAGLAREISDRVTLSETVTGISGDYYIQGIDWSITDRNTFHFSWLVVPTDPFASWLIGLVGSSEIGQTTRVGY